MTVEERCIEICNALGRSESLRREAEDWAEPQRTSRLIAAAEAEALENGTSAQELARILAELEMACV